MTDPRPALRELVRFTANGPGISRRPRKRERVWFPGEETRSEFWFIFKSLVSSPTLDPTVVQEIQTGDRSTPKG